MFQRTRLPCERKTRSRLQTHSVSVLWLLEGALPGRPAAHRGSSRHPTSALRAIQVGTEGRGNECKFILLVSVEPRQPLDVGLTSIFFRRRGPCPTRGSQNGMFGKLVGVLSLSNRPFLLFFSHCTLILCLSQLICPLLLLLLFFFALFSSPCSSPSSSLCSFPRSSPLLPTILSRLLSLFTILSFLLSILFVPYLFSTSCPSFLRSSHASCHCGKCRLVLGYYLTEDGKCHSWDCSVGDGAGCKACFAQNLRTRVLGERGCRSRP